MKERLHQNAETIRVWTVVVARVILMLVGLALIAWLLYEIRTLLLLLVLSIFFCYLIAPIVQLVEQPLYIFGHEFRTPRAVAILIVYVLIAVVLVAVVQLIWQPLSEQLAALVQNLPGYAKSAESSVNKIFNDANSWMRHIRLPVQWRESIFTRAGEIANSLAVWLTESAAAALTYFKYLTWPILIPILSFFLLKDASLFEQNLVALMPNERLQKRAHWLLMDVSSTLAAYIRAQITACLVVGSVMMLGLSLIGAPYPIVLGAVGGLLEFFPLIGPLIAAVFVVLLTLTISIKTALLVALFLGVLRLAQDYLIYPRIVGRGIRMHPLVVIIAILAGAEIAGLVGVFLSIPIVGLVIVFYNHYLAYRGIQNLRVVVNTDQPVVAETTPLSATGSTAPAGDN